MMIFQTTLKLIHNVNSFNSLDFMILQLSKFGQDDIRVMIKI